MAITTGTPASTSRPIWLRRRPKTRRNSDPEEAAETDAGTRNLSR